MFVENKQYISKQIITFFFPHDAYHTVSVNVTNCVMDIDHAGPYLIAAYVGNWVGKEPFYFVHWLQ